jgi:hypothetical protein
VIIAEERISHANHSRDKSETRFLLSPVSGRRPVHGEELKPLLDLTLKDLSLHPVWQYHLDHDSRNEYVEESELTELTESDFRAYIAATNFILHDGSQLLGFCSPQDSSGSDYVQPVIIADGRHIPLWSDQPSSVGIVAELRACLGKTESQIFPIRCECIIPVDGIRLAYTISSLNETGAA